MAYIEIEFLKNQSISDVLLNLSEFDCFFRDKNMECLSDSENKRTKALLNSLLDFIKNKGGVLLMRGDNESRLTQEYGQASVLDYLFLLGSKANEMV